MKRLFALACSCMALVVLDIGKVLLFGGNYLLVGGFELIILGFIVAWASEQS